MSNEINENKVQEEFRGAFKDRVHKIGRTTMSVGFVLSMLPVLYLYFIAGYRPPLQSFVTAAIAISAFAVGMWLTEPVSYFPILGAAGTYMGYFAGNVSNMRVPIAMSLQSAFKTDVNTPKGTLVTIIGIAISVFVNLVILLVIVMAGSSLLNVLPPKIIKALGFVMPALLGSMVTMRLSSSGVLKGLIFALPAVAVFFICKAVPTLATFGVAIAVGVSVLFAYILDKTGVMEKIK